MKTQVPYINGDESYQWKTTHHNKKKIGQVLCPQGCKATIVCFQKNCSSPAFACTQEKCSCEKLHQKCDSRKCSSVIKNLQQKLVNFQPILNEVDKLISQKISQYQRIIQNLIKQKKQLIQHMSDTKSLFGLTETEQYIYQSMLNKTTDDISGKEMHINKQSIFKGVQSVIQPEMKKIKQFWKDPQINLGNLQAKINQFRNSYKKLNFNYMIQKSRIVTTFDQKIQLNANFNQDIEKMQLLYRVEDKRFKYNEFKIKCGHLPNTLILIKTDTKKIGCFTDIKWNQVQAQGLRKGSQQTFLTSLTTHYRAKDKITIGIDKKFRGPFFQDSSSHTLLIKDESIYCDIKIFGTAMENNVWTKSWPFLQIEVWQVFLQKQRST